MKKRLFKILVGIIIGIFWAALIAEIGLRVMIARNIVPNRVPADIFAAHRIGWALEPNIDVHVLSPNGIIGIRTNSQGFRDQEYPFTRSPQKERILILGDSFTLALETPQSETYHEQLEALYQGKVEVISMGVSGYEIAQSLMVYQEVGYRYEPDRVIFMLFVGNDLTGNLRLPTLPHYEFDAADELVRVNYPYTDEFYLPLVAGQRSTSLMKTSALGFIAGLALREPPTFPHVDYCQSLPIGMYPNPSDEAWELSEALLLKLRDEVTTHGSKFQIALLPTKLQIEPDDVAHYLQECGTPPQPLQSTAQPHLATFLEANQITYLDLLPFMQAARSTQNERLYLTGQEGHWTIEGHAVVAETLYNWLEAED